jgi:uncharacterized membrane protein
MGISDYIFIGLVFLGLIYIMLEIRHRVLVNRLENKPGDNPEHLKWGIFYFNPDDPRMVVPKRIPSMGWTLNFGRPGAIIFLFAFIGVLVLLIIL